jgi:hypothetical protein
MPVSWERPFPVDFDQWGDDAVRRILTTQAGPKLLKIYRVGLAPNSVGRLSSLAAIRELTATVELKGL